MNDKPKSSWSQRWDSFMRRHPLICLIVVLALALLTGPLMIAASQATAVLYKDF